MDDFVVEIKERGFKTIVFLCSGGFDSTFMLLKLFNRFPECEKQILYCNTTIEMKSCYNLVYNLSFITNIPVTELKPNCNVKEVLSRSFSQVDRGRKLYELHEFSKKSVFNCCYYLKEKPASQYYKTIDRKQVIALKGFRSDDAIFRQRFLGKLRKRGTYIHFNKKDRIYFGYPLRDIDESEINSFINGMNQKVKHSACVICPVLLVYEKMNKENLKRYAASQRFYLKLKNSAPCVQF